jgi:hypothetical protein
MAFDPISAVLDIGGKIIDRVWPNPEERDKAKLALLQMQQQGELQAIAGQMEVNKAEAASQSVFVAGWRPFIGWICGCALAYQFILAPLFTWGAALAGHPVTAPPLDFGDLFTLLAGMLGLSGMRTFEKVQNAQSNGH